MNTLNILPNGIVKLTLPFCTRYIGKILGDTYTKRVKPETHKFNKNNSVGFNFELIDKGNFKFVIIEFGEQLLYTTRLYILHTGKTQTFYKQNFEKQLFLPLDEFGLKKALEFEGSQQTQLSLFRGAS